MCFLDYVFYVCSGAANGGRAGATGPMGRWADLPASALDDREGVYIKPQSAVVTTSTIEKTKKLSLYGSDSDSNTTSSKP